MGKYKDSSSSLDGALHRLTPSPIYSILESITLVLTMIIYSKIYSSWDAMSDEIWNEGISGIGNF